MYAAMQTPDGWIEHAEPLGGEASSRFRIDVAVPVPDALRGWFDGRIDEVVFAARSRLARLGINVQPTGKARLAGEQATFEALVQPTVKAYDVGRFLPELLVPGLRVGRFVMCPRERRLTSEQVDELVQAHQIQLPRSYSIDGDGRFRIRPQGWVYEMASPLTLETLRTILMREGGKDILNRLQVRRPVRRIALEAGDGVITSCSMFLHRHYVVLESQPTDLGQHLEAVVLDPITTRGMDVYLEFHNRGDRRIVNPTVAASVYEAVETRAAPRVWHMGLELPPATAKGATSEERSYEAMAHVFDRLEEHALEERYSHRLVAVVEDMQAVLAGAEPRWTWCHPEGGPSPRSGTDISSRVSEGVVEAPWRVPFGTAMLKDLPAGLGGTLLLGYFPNLIEHAHICAAALERKIKRIIFRRASFEHGPFFSARDHGRLADYEGLGVEVFWCNDLRRHVVQHVFRGLRGYFTEADKVERFRSALIFAGYGSSRLLPPDQVERMKNLIVRLADFFGPDIAFMTGGGPGAMQQVTDIAQERGIIVGASYIEIEDQGTNKTSDFYQTFQGRSRQSRQRWFEIASFHLFFMGGVGTLEEVGLTLTDMKLGVIERSPVVFFGRHEGKPYWRHQIKQFRQMVEAGRAPTWLDTHVLLTDEPDDVLPFYKRLLELG
ncbi:MAG: LOG family protein [Planctomycetes bacterium]|nr:LOG family protein [Planctomycetota bacterium]MCB9828900.1 LOG family protein [Planctomycetota bacterium]MCB9902031.1 LOG family protein [Planctomycetota bacterium]